MTQDERRVIEACPCRDVVENQEREVRVGVPSEQTVEQRAAAHVFAEGLEVHGVGNSEAQHQ